MNCPDLLLCGRPSHFLGLRQQAALLMWRPAHLARRAFSTNVNSRIQKVQESFFKPVRTKARLTALVRTLTLAGLLIAYRLTRS